MTKLFKQSIENHIQKFGILFFGIFAFTSITKAAQEQEQKDSGNNNAEEVSKPKILDFLGYSVPCENPEKVVESLCGLNFIPRSSEQSTGLDVYLDPGVRLSFVEAHHKEQKPMVGLRVNSIEAFKEAGYTLVHDIGEITLSENQLKALQPAFEKLKSENEGVLKGDLQLTNEHSKCVILDFPGTDAPFMAVEITSSALIFMYNMLGHHPFNKLLRQ